MPGPNTNTHQPISSVQTTSGLTPFTAAGPEKAAQTFKIGVPVQLSTGYVQEWDGATLAGAIAGFSMTYGANLPTNGAGAPSTWGQVGAPGAIQTYGTVLNQASAVKIAVGTPMSDGRTLFESAVGLTIFEATFDNSNGSIASDYTPTQAMIGTQFGLTRDANGQWYVDAYKHTAGTNTVVQLVGISPVDGFIVNARVYIQVLAAARQDYI